MGKGQKKNVKIGFEELLQGAEWLLNKTLKVRVGAAYLFSAESLGGDA